MLQFQYLLVAVNLAYNKYKLCKTVDYWFGDMLNLDFLEKNLGIVFLQHFVYSFSRKIFLLLYSVSWPNFIACFPLLGEILRNVWFLIVCWPGCDVTNFEIGLIFLIRLFFLYDQKVKIKIQISWEQK